MLAWSWKANGGTTATISGGPNAVVQKEDTAKLVKDFPFGGGAEALYNNYCIHLINTAVFSINYHSWLLYDDCL